MSDVLKAALAEVQKQLIAKTREREELDAEITRLEALVRSLRNAARIIEPKL